MLIHAPYGLVHDALRFAPASAVALMTGLGRAKA
jgi:hypothetical protein